MPFSLKCRTSSRIRARRVRGMRDRFLVILGRANAPVRGRQANLGQGNFEFAGRVSVQPGGKPLPDALFFCHCIFLSFPPARSARTPSSWVTHPLEIGGNCELTLMQSNEGELIFDSSVVTGYLIRPPSQAASGFSGYTGPGGAAGEGSHAVNVCWVRNQASDHTPPVTPPGHYPPTFLAS